MHNHIFICKWLTFQKSIIPPIFVKYPLCAVHQANPWEYDGGKERQAFLYNHCKIHGLWAGFIPYYKWLMHSLLRKVYSCNSNRN